MCLRLFTFCDVCNPQAIRILSEKHHNRRNSDGRSWFEGNHDEAVKAGWKILEKYNIACPNCIEKGMDGLLINSLSNFKGLELR